MFTGDVAYMSTLDSVPGRPRCHVSCRKHHRAADPVSEHEDPPSHAQTGRQDAASSWQESFLQFSCKISELMFSIKVASEVRLYPQCVNQP